MIRIFSFFGCWKEISGLRKRSQNMFEGLNESMSGILKKKKTLDSAGEVLPSCRFHQIKERNLFDRAFVYGSKESRGVTHSIHLALFFGSMYRRYIFIRVSSSFFRIIVLVPGRFLCVRHKEAPHYYEI